MKQRSDFWTCPKCNGRNHFSSDSCYSADAMRAALLAAYAAEPPAWARTDEVITLPEA